MHVETMPHALPALDQSDPDATAGFRLVTKTSKHLFGLHKSGEHRALIEGERGFDR